MAHVLDVTEQSLIEILNNVSHYREASADLLFISGNGKVVWQRWSLTSIGCLLVVSALLRFVVYGVCFSLHFKVNHDHNHELR